MKLTKYEHACFTLEKDGRVLVVDPGGWSGDFAAVENVVAVVVTHEHADHFSLEKLQAIVQQNPEVVIFAHPDVAGQMAGLPAQSVAAGDAVTIGPFALEFFGGDHATIHPDFGHFANLGVLVNDTLYYPGDSFALPQKPVKVLALPVAAPWLKISETIDFMLSVQPEIAFPTHDAIASSLGKELLDRLVGGVAQEHRIEYRRVHSLSLTPDVPPVAQQTD